MRSSVRKRGATWTWYLWRPDPLSGKPRQRTKGGYRTKRECQGALSEPLVDGGASGGTRTPTSEGHRVLNCAFGVFTRPAGGQISRLSRASTLGGSHGVPLRSGASR